MIVSTDADPAPLTGAVRRALMDVDRDVAVYRVITLESHLGEAMADSRLTATLVGACGALALLLSLVGVYGVVSYAVGRRAREIGLRVALGARPRDIVRLVLGEGSRILVAGVVSGLLGAALATRLLQSLLFGVSALDTGTFVIVTAALGIAALAAAALPARKALRVDPIAQLRQ
jgi:putative ABC transport system permease protein